MIWTALSRRKALALAQSRANEFQRTFRVYRYSGRYFVFPAHGFPGAGTETVSPSGIPFELCRFCGRPGASHFTPDGRLIGPPYCGDVAAALSEVQGELIAATKRLGGRDD